MRVQMRLGFWLLTFLISFSAAARDGFEVPPLYVRPFSSLVLNSPLSRLELNWILQTAADRLYGEAFVDIGDMSDWMHGHVLFEPLQPNAPLVLHRAMAVLFHTQEYPQLRVPATYKFRGQTLDPYDRSWLFWLTPNAKGKMTPAYLSQPNPGPNWPTTVSSDMLDPNIFGEDASKREAVFFFFRFACEDVDAAHLSPADLAISNVIEVTVGGQRTCLALEDDACVSGIEDPGVCLGSLPLRSFVRPSTVAN